MHDTNQTVKAGITLALLLLVTFIFASPLSAAPFEIEGYIKQIRIIEVKQPYTFNYKPIISIYIVGHRYGKDFDYQYMVVKDSTQLEGISFSDLKTGMYVRVKSRAEPPGMLGKPIQEIRASRYGCCNYTLHIDTVFTPRDISAYITRVDSFSATDIVVTVRENKDGAPHLKYLIVNGKTTIQNGSFSDIKVAEKINISQAGINVPVPADVDHGKLYGADLYATIVTINKMKFALMTYTFARQDWKKDDNFDLGKMCKVGKELGIDGVDIVSHSFSLLDPENIRKVLEEHGQKVVCYTFFPQLNNPTKAGREAGIEEVKKAIEIAKRLGTDKVMIHTPGNSKMTAEECRVNWIHGLQEAIALINAAGLTLTIESIRHSPLATSAEMLRVVREVPGIKLVFDTGNVYASGEDPVAFYNACREHIVHAHFKDGRWYDKTNTDGSTQRDFSNELIGEGDINLAECVKAMVNDGYKGYVDIEYESNTYTPDIANQKAIEYINSILETN